MKIDEVRHIFSLGADTMGQQIVLQSARLVVPLDPIGTVIIGDPALGGPG